MGFSGCQQQGAVNTLPYRSHLIPKALLPPPIPIKHHHTLLLTSPEKASNKKTIQYREKDKQVKNQIIYRLTKNQTKSQNIKAPCKPSRNLLLNPCTTPSPGKSSTCSPCRSNLCAVKGPALTAPNCSKKGPRGPDQ
jgi:hypothetical protein